MISRRQIISKSVSEMEEVPQPDFYDTEEDIWINKDKLFSDHIQEILRKWEQIDDEIWGKIIYMERNRRIAKAYARAPMLTINGSEDGFDGYKIGLNGFESPTQDSLVRRVKRRIGHGVRVKMDESGNINIKRLSDCDVFVGSSDRSTFNGSEPSELNAELEFEKSVKLFDMKKFQASINRELRSAYLDRRKLENQCICVIAFVKDAPNLLDLPVWCMIINIVALDMLKSRLPPMGYRAEPVPQFLSIFDRQNTVKEENPYAVPLPLLNKQESRETIRRKVSPPLEQKPPELPPRDLTKIPKKKKTNKFNSVLRTLVRGKSSRKNTSGSSSKNSMSTSTLTKESKHTLKDDKDYEDPYYCGMRARICNNPSRERKSVPGPLDMQKTHSISYLNSLFNHPTRNLNYSNNNNSSSYSPQYDSSFESDPYAMSSTDYDIYGYGPIYGRTTRTFGSIYGRTKRYPTVSDRERFAPDWD